MSKIIKIGGVNFQVEFFPPSEDDKSWASVTALNATSVQETEMASKVMDRINTRFNTGVYKTQREKPDAIELSDAASENSSRIFVSQPKNFEVTGFASHGMFNMAVSNYLIDLSSDFNSHPHTHQPHTPRHSQLSQSHASGGFSNRVKAPLKVDPESQTRR